MTFVDSSVWIDFFRSCKTIQTIALKRLLVTEQIVTADLVLVEVLQGTRDEKTYAHILELMTIPQVIVISNADVAVRAAGNYRALRKRGITIRKTIDTLIATRCILDRAPLLYSDRDFDPFVRHLGLRSALDPPGVQ